MVHDLGARALGAYQAAVFSPMAGVAAAYLCQDGPLGPKIFMGVCAALFSFHAADGIADAAMGTQHYVGLKALKGVARVFHDYELEALAGDITQDMLDCRERGRLILARGKN